MKHIVQVSRQVGGDGFVDILEEEIEELIESHRETLTNEELEELIKSSTEGEDDDDEQEEPASWNLHKFAEVFQAVKHLNDLISESNPSMERSLKITRSITDDLRPYQEMFEPFKRQQRLLPITMFVKRKQPAADELTQSTSRAEPEPTTSSTTCSPSPPSPGSISSPDNPPIVLLGKRKTNHRSVYSAHLHRLIVHHTGAVLIIISIIIVVASPLS
ncbi:uncharacterized protein LOC101931329 isoform X2 [Chrysemys picta bellii]|uniref:uncharacterized protein LOC101931329 isoform X2 n=1 Tax=Chrysemys picta bellii TaxID=8478 RepID=UPI0032B22739